MKTAAHEHGHTLVEMLIAGAIIVTAAAMAVPYVRAYAVEAHLLGAGRTFKGKFREARSIATRANVYTAIRFENQGGRWHYSLYQDGDFDGVTAADIRAGRDPRIAGPFPLDAGARGVRVGINAGVPAPPPYYGMLDPDGDPIRLGAGNISLFNYIQKPCQQVYHIEIIIISEEYRPPRHLIRLNIYTKTFKNVQHLLQIIKKN